MGDFRKVTEDFSVAPQIAIADADAAAKAGFALMINNRPDGEEPGQPTAAEMETAARKAGLDYVHIPVVGRPTAEQVEAVRAAVEKATGPVLAYCRSGTRSIVTWSIGQATSGARPRGDLVDLAREAGYDLEPVLGA